MKNINVLGTLKQLLTKVVFMGFLLAIAAYALHSEAATGQVKSSNSGYGIGSVIFVENQSGGSAFTRSNIQDPKTVSLDRYDAIRSSKALSRGKHVKQTPKK